MFKNCLQCYNKFNDKSLRANRKYCSSLCVKIWGKIWKKNYFKIESNLIKKRDVDRYYQSKKRKEMPEYKREESRVYREKYPEKVLAQQKLNIAIRSGKVKRSPCEICGEIRVHAHHPNYERPLDVQFLCPIHHKLIHNKQ